MVHLPFVLLICALFLLTGCTDEDWGGDPKLRAFYQSGNLSAAMEYLNRRLEEDPKALHLHRQRVLIFLSSEDGLAPQYALNAFNEGAKHGLQGSDISSFLRHRSGIIRRNAAHLFGMLGDKSGLPGLKRSAQDQDLHVQQAAIKSLGKLKDPSAKIVLLLGLKNSDWLIRAESAEALAAIGAGDCVKYLFRALEKETEDRYVQDEIRNALMQLVSRGDKDVYKEFLHCEQTRVKQCAAMGLALIGEQEAISILAKMQEGSKDVSCLEELTERSPSVALKVIGAMDFNRQAQEVNKFVQDYLRNRNDRESARILAELNIPE